MKQINLYSQSTPVLLPVGQIDDNPWRGITDRNPAKVKSLMVSFRELGLQRTFSVRVVKNAKGEVRHQLALGGHHMLDALRELGVSSVPCLVLDISDTQMQDHMLRENSPDYKTITAQDVRCEYLGAVRYLQSLPQELDRVAIMGVKDAGKHKAARETAHGNPAGDTYVARVLGRSRNFTTEMSWALRALEAKRIPGKDGKPMTAQELFAPTKTWAACSAEIRAYQTTYPDPGTADKRGAGAIGGKESGESRTANPPRDKLHLTDEEKAARKAKRAAKKEGAPEIGTPTTPLVGETPIAPDVKLVEFSSILMQACAVAVRGTLTTQHVEAWKRIKASVIILGRGLESKGWSKAIEKATLEATNMAEKLFPDETSPK